MQCAAAAGVKPPDLARGGAKTPSPGVFVVKKEKRFAMFIWIYIWNIHWWKNTQRITSKNTQTEQQSEENRLNERKKKKENKFVKLLKRSWD